MMRDNDIERVLSGEREILPSPGFVGSVMDSVRREAGAPPPIPFPWKRALPGISVAAMAVVALLVAGATILMRGGVHQQIPASVSSTFTMILQAWENANCTWITLALVLSFASVRLSMRFARVKT